MPKKQVTVTNEDLASKIDALTGILTKSNQDLTRSVTKQNQDLTRSVAKSIEDLAGMTQRGFTEVGERFDRVEGRLDLVESRLDGVEKGLKQVKAEVSHLGFVVTELVRRDEFLELKQRVQALESQLARK